nr:MAG TPA: hypothetical protein [Caudoviricetes sp.]
MTTKVRCICSPQIILYIFLHFLQQKKERFLAFNICFN